jgi:hypothetical protein
MEPVDERWRFVSIGGEGDATDVGGVNPWNVHWHPTHGHVVVAHPQYPAQRHIMDTYVVAGANPPIVFAAGAFSKGIWGFYVPTDRRTVMTESGRLKYEADRWSTSGEKINSTDNFARIKAVLDESGPIIVEWWHLRGASAPDRLFFDDYDRFVEWLDSRPPGDKFYVWDFAKVCLDDNQVARGKYPDGLGEIPAGGPY